MISSLHKYGDEQHVGSSFDFEGKIINSRGSYPNLWLRMHLSQVNSIMSSLVSSFLPGTREWRHYKEGWALKNWCFWTVGLEKTLESLLDSKEIKPVNPRENQSWIFIVRTDAETPVLQPPDAKRQLIGKHPDAGKDWRQKEKGAGEDKTVG